MKRRGCINLVGVFLLAGCLLVGGCQNKPKDDRIKDYQTLNPQKDFTLIDQNGQAFHLKDHRNEVILLFFGYLTCPDICPMTLSKISRAYNLLGNLKSKVLTVFVSVDTERDTPARLKEYLSFFSLNAVGLTGTKKQVDEIVGAYKATYERVETESAAGYLYNHTDYIYIIDKQGTVRYLVHSEDKPEQIAEVIKQLLK